MSSRVFLRHSLATINYRANASICGAPESFAATRVSAEHWNALQTLGHMNDVLHWALSIARGSQEWKPSDPKDWSDAVANFYGVLSAFDDQLQRAEIEDTEAMKIFQGPLADVLTHIGQLAGLRRLCGAPIAPQNYHAAEIEVGQFGPQES